MKIKDYPVLFVVRYRADNPPHGIGKQKLVEAEDLQAVLGLYDNACAEISELSQRLDAVKKERDMLSRWAVKYMRERNEARRWARKFYRQLKEAECPNRENT